MGVPLLDNQFIGHNKLVKKVAQQTPDECEEIAKDVLNSIAERDIYTGDFVELTLVDTKGITVKKDKIRRD